MVPAEEEYFPRGNKPLSKAPRPQKRPAKTEADDNLFSTSKNAPKAKKAKTQKVKETHVTLTEDSFQSSIQVKGCLTYQKVQDGMVILGCIRHITNYSLELEFPGLVFANVNVTQISDHFTHYLNKKLETTEEEDDGSETDFILKNMFTLGQFVPTKVLSVGHGDRGFKISASLNPREINEGKRHNALKKNMLIWANIQSVLDHGYELSVGIKNCRVFLPKENIDEGKVYTIGEPLWCVVHKLTDSETASTLRVSAKKEHVNASSAEQITSLNDLIPGMQVEFVTDRVVETGIQGKFLEDYFGYVNENFLRKPLHQISNYQEGKILKAYVLYVEPATKITHLTLRGWDMYQPASLKNGDVISAEVSYKTGLGLYFKLPNEQKGFTANKRLINCLPKGNIDDLSTTIAAKFPAGSVHKCRILDFNYLSQMYVVTVEPNLIKENLFMPNDLGLGKVLKVKIDIIKDEGLVVSAGSLRGFVPNFHISNSQYSENVKRKYVAGMRVNARVIDRNEKGVFFTLKQGLVEADNCLTSFDKAVVGQKYTGFIVQTTTGYAIVAFYGSVKGKIHRKSMSDNKDSSSVDPTKYFYRGQVVNVWIVAKNDGKLILSLKEPTIKTTTTTTTTKKLTMRVGQQINGIVTDIHEDRLDVKSTNGRIIGCVPVNHLSPYLRLCKPMMKMFPVGSEIKNLICVKCDTTPPTFSRREFIRAKNIKRFEQLKKGRLVRCFYESKDEKGIYVTVLTKDFHDKVLITNKNIHNNPGTKLLKYQSQQVILGKILDIDVNKRTLKLTTKIDPSTNYTLTWFGQCLADLHLLRQFGRQHNWPHCAYSPGEQIQCEIVNVTEMGCIVSLPNGCTGLVPVCLCPVEPKSGDKVKGVILSHDFDNEFVEVSINQSYNRHINKNQKINVDLSHKSACLVEKLLYKKDDHILSVLKQSDGAKQFVYIPVLLHENYSPSPMSPEFYYDQPKFKVCICGKYKNNLIGISRKLFITLEKDKNKKKINKLAINEFSDKYEESQNGEDEEELEDEATDEMDGEDVEEAEEDDSESEETEDIEEVFDDEGDLEDEEEQEDEENDDSMQQVNVEEPKLGEKRKAAQPILPGIGSFFDTNNTNGETVADSSSDEEDDEGEVVKKKKKLSRAERVELLRQEEEKIAKIEKRFAANSNVDPESADDFDRLLTANPDSSELWTKYMAFHISSTEIDKARAVAKRALESINMTLSEDRLNIWIALLHLENSYGNRETFDKTFDEAIKCNDSLKVYLRVIEMLADNGKLADMEEKIKKARNKHKQDPKMWIEIAKVYYTIKKFREARNMKDCALKSIHDKKTQMSLIVRFAIMEFKFGEEEQGAAIFESILNTDPRKVNIWSTYVDQLVKNDKIDQARKVLERSVCQKLPVKSMKTLFMKFRKFEEEHGTAATVEAVKEKAQAFIKRFSK